MFGSRTARRRIGLGCDAERDAMLSLGVGDIREVLDLAYQDGEEEGGIEAVDDEGEAKEDGPEQPLPPVKHVGVCSEISMAGLN